MVLCPPAEAPQPDATTGILPSCYKFRASAGARVNQSRPSRFERWRSAAGLIGGPFLALLILLLPLPTPSPEAHRLAAVAALVVVFWITEAIPIPVTALLGVALAILLGIAPAGEILGAYGDPVIFLFIGSFMLARGMQVQGVDRRIAYALLANRWVGGSTYRTLWALGLTAWLLSMWISNTASVAMLFPVALAIARATGELLQVPRDPDVSAEVPRLRYTTGLLLMLAYAGSIGGLATPIGSPPNLIGIALIDQQLGISLEFFQWMMFGLPAALLLLVVAYGIVILVYRPEVRQVPGQLKAMRAAHRSLGPWTAGQRNSLIAFGTAVSLWLLPGVVSLILGAESDLARTLSGRLPESVVALLAAALLFLLPTNWQRREFTLTWPDGVRIDWGTVLLFGGGIALGRLLFETGLAAALGEGLVAATGADSLIAMTGVATLIASLISETSSNTASANLVIPVMLSVTNTALVSGLPVALAATLGASMGFMLPVSTPPNAIVYGSGAVRLSDMIRAGLLLDVCGVLVVWLVSTFWIPLVLGTVF